MKTANEGVVSLFGTDSEREAFRLPSGEQQRLFRWHTPDGRIYESQGSVWYESSRGFPHDMLTSEREAYRRLQVDVSQTGFWEGREFRISYEYSISTTPRVLKFFSSVDFVLLSQTLSCDAEGVKFQAYREGTEGGTFSTVVPIWRNNFTAEAEATEYTRQAVITTGGTFTPSGSSVETIRILTSNATAQRSSVGGSAIKERGLAAGTYYLMLSNLLGSGTATGVFDLIWEERL